MDSTHIHLLITHLPVFGSLLGAFVLIQAIWTKSHPTIVAAYSLLLCSSAGAVIAYLTGEGAEETAEHIQGIAENMIEQHEESALAALSALIVLGVVSLAGLFVEYRKFSFSYKTAIGVLLISLISFMLVARTGYLGGQIRHTEINSGGVIQQQEVNYEENHNE